MLPVIFSGAMPMYEVMTPHVSDCADPRSKIDGLRFVARQPILDSKEQVFGYELLFRDGFENYFHAADPDLAARSTLDSSILVGLDTLCTGRLAFVNCTRDVLMQGHVRLLPPNLTVVEVLETIEPDAEVLGACRQLKQAGYRIALDDFINNDPREGMSDLADIIKVDLRLTTEQQRAAMIKRYAPSHCRMLAEKVETREEFQIAKQQGFHYFQGYFFRKPEVLTTQEVPENRINYIRMLQAVSGVELDLRKIEKLIKSEVSLCYRLLRYLNSAIFSFGSEIHSVRHALSMLGEREIRRWVQLVATIGAAQQRSSEVVLNALVRARFCELLGSRAKVGDADLFFLGLLSLMDAILDIPIAKVLEKVPVDQETKTVLLGQPSPLRPLYQLMLAQESGEWQEVATLAQRLHLQDSTIADFYWDAMRWAREVSSLSS